MTLQRVKFPHRGFTLVELLICIGIVAIAAAVVVPAISASTTMSVESVARVLAADLRLAGSLAVQYDTEWTVRFDVPRNTYEIVHNGSGTPPPLRNPFAAPGDPPGLYRVPLERLTVAARPGAQVRLLGAKRNDTDATVTEITFTPLGGTGPVRSADTHIWLAEGTGTNTRFIRLTVSWITGQVWIDRPTSFEP